MNAKDRMIKALIDDYAAEATRLIMEGYATKEVSNNTVYNTVRAALVLLAERVEGYEGG